jgi:uncharacterized protein (TIGR02118 family)
MYKCVFAISYRADRPRKAMYEYWERVHAPLVLAVPGLVKYVVSDVTEDLGGTPFDGLAELYFADRAAYDPALASDYWADTVAADGENFLDTSKTFGAILKESQLR